MYEPITIELTLEEAVILTRKLNRSLEIAEAEHLKYGTDATREARDVLDDVIAQIQAAKRDAF